MYWLDFGKPTPIHLCKLYTYITEGWLSTGQLLHVPNTPPGHYGGYFRKHALTAERNIPFYH